MHMNKSDILIISVIIVIFFANICPAENFGRLPFSRIMMEETQNKLSDILPGLGKQITDQLESADIKIDGLKKPLTVTGVVHPLDTEGISREDIERPPVTIGVSGQDSLNSKLIKICKGAPNIDGLIFGYLEEILLHDSLYLAVGVYSCSEDKFQIFAPNKPIPLTETSLEDALEIKINELVRKMTRAAGSSDHSRLIDSPLPEADDRRIPSTPSSGSTATGATGSKPPSGSVKEEGFDDLISFAKKHGVKEVPAASRPKPQKRVSQTSPNLIADIQKVYEMCYLNRFYIFPDSLRFRAAREVEKGKNNKQYKQWTKEFASNLKITIAKLKKIDIGRHLDHSQAIELLKDPYPTIGWDLKFNVAEKKVTKVSNSMVQFIYLTDNDRIDYKLCLYKRQELRKVGSIDEIVSHYNNTTGYSDWRLPSLEEFLALDSLFIPPIGERALYWTSSPTSDGGLWVVEKEYENYPNKPKPMIRLSFFNSKRYDINNCMKAYILLIRDC